MKRSEFLFCISAVAVLAFGASSATAAPPGPAGSTTCSGATTLAPGIYNDLRVTGYCKIDSRVVIDGNVRVADGAYLDATYAGTRLLINGNVTVGKGAKLGLGCSFGYHDCGLNPTWLGSVIVNGDIDANNALTMYLDFTIVQGDVDWKGGGDPTMGDSQGQEGLVLPIKDNVIGGNLRVDGWAGAWFGIVRNKVLGNVTASHTTGNRVDPDTGDPDSTEIVTNVITGNLKCDHNSPPAQIGDSGGTPNIVLGKKSGECAGL